MCRFLRKGIREEEGRTREKPGQSSCRRHFNHGRMRLTVVIETVRVRVRSLRMQHPQLQIDDSIPPGCLNLHVEVPIPTSPGIEVDYSRRLRAVRYK